jgi:hypothetical protein
MGGLSRRDEKQSWPRRESASPPASYKSGRELPPCPIPSSAADKGRELAPSFDFQTRFSTRLPALKISEGRRSRRFRLDQ